MAVQGQTSNQPTFIRYYLQFPPVTRTLITLIVLVTVCVQFNFINGYSLYSSFLGSILRFFYAGWGLSFLITCIMLYQQCSQLEQNFSTADFTWMLLIVAATIMTLSRIITPFGLYLPALYAGISYYWAKLNPHASIHVYIINVPAPYYPWVFLTIDFVAHGPIQAAVDFTGIVGAQLHYFITEEWPRRGGRRIDTPVWFKNLFRPHVNGPERPTVERPFGTFIPPRDRNDPANTGSSSGVFGRRSGNFRGPGHRLG